MSHPFGDLLSQYLHRKHGFSQAKLAEKILQAPAVISDMCKGRRLTGWGARGRVLDIIECLWAEGVLAERKEADALLAAAGMANLDARQEREGRLLAKLDDTAASASAAANPALAEPSLRPPLTGATAAGQAFSPTHNLPAALTSFVGRRQQLEEVEHLLKSYRLVTLTGAGGAGKTRLALQVAAGFLSGLTDGVWWVELAPLSDPALLPQAVASALGLQDEGGRPLRDRLVAHLQVRELLLVLDNCEHLVGACAAFVDAALRAAPRLRILATSREPLAIGGEMTYRVPPLETPGAGDLAHSAALAQYEAVQLFAQRAGAAAPGFSLSEANGAAIAEICCRLDGMPLAIELAAARLGVLSVEQIRDRLDDRFRLLTGGSRVALPRQQTLRAAIDWSYDLLTQPESTLFRRLAVFMGGWTLEAAEEVCSSGDLRQEQILDLLARLAGKSLAVPEQHAGRVRYHMLETVRQYAAEKLAESGELAGLRRRHAAYFLRLAEQAELKLETSERMAWYARLDDEHGNMRAALGYLRDHGAAEWGLRLAGSLWRFWETRGHLSEGRGWLDELLSLASSFTGPGGPPVVAPSARAKALKCAGACKYYQRNIPAALAQLEESLALYRRLGDRQGIANVLTYLGWLATEQGDFVRADTFLQEKLSLCREIDDAQGTALALCHLGLVAYWSGDPRSAWPLLEQGLALFREIDDPFGLASWGQVLALTLYELGELNLARGLAEEDIQRCRELGYRRNIGICHIVLGLVAREQEDRYGAQVHLKEALVVARELADPFLLGAVAVASTLVSAALSRPAQALCVGGAAAAAAERAGYVLPMGLRAKFEGVIEAAQRALSAEDAGVAWMQGRNMPIEQVVAEALAG